MRHLSRISIVTLAASVLLTGTSFARPAAFDNTLTGLIPDLYAALDVVSRELVGFIPAVNRDTSAERAAVGEAVKYTIAPAANVADITPAMVPPEPTDQTIGFDSIVITKAKRAEFGWVGEQQKGLNNGPGYLTVQQDQIAQALRSLTNMVELDLAVAATAAASRASGVGGTTPFGTNLGDSAQLRKILDDNGAPPGDRSLIISTATGASLRTLGQLTKANEAGSIMNAQQGSLMNLHNFTIAETGQSQFHTKGTGASGTTNTTGYAIGSTAITLAAAGTGTILAGDYIAFAGDTNQYEVTPTGGVASLAAGGVVTITLPGLMKAIPASAVAVTLANSFTANIGFVRSAIGLAFRLPALPEEGDGAADRRTITDVRSGLTFEIAIYKGYRKVRYEIACAWGVKVIKPAHVAALLG